MTTIERPAGDAWEYAPAPESRDVVTVRERYGLFINGREVVVTAGDSTIKGGSWYPITIKKLIRAMEVAIEQRSRIHQGFIQPEAIKVIAEVVMVTNILFASDLTIRPKTVF